jgi:hypothetical protein
MTPGERQAVNAVLGNEYSVLMSALNAAWSASLNRTSIFIYLLSAAGVALAALAGRDPKRDQAAPSDPTPMGWIRRSDQPSGFNMTRSP